MCIDDFPCPRCSSRHPRWSFFENYERYLISNENNKKIEYIVTVPRYKCFSCNHTHAILPEIVIPYSSYSLLFVLHVLRDRYDHELTVDTICQKYNISIRTFYRFIKLYKQNKVLWLGILEEIYTSSNEFHPLQPSKETSKFHYLFWLNNGLSFLQQTLHGEIVHFDIRLHPPPAFSSAFT